LIQHSRPTRFGEKYRDELSTADNIEVLLESNLLAFVPDREARTVKHVDVATLQGRHFRVAARRYVLACGSIENARLLLASNSVVADGLGNGRDLVGRYFMDHPRIRPAGRAFWTDSRAKKLEQFTRVDGVRATLAADLTPARQHRDHLVNSMIFAEAMEPLATVANERPGDVAVAEFLQRLGAEEVQGLSPWWVRSEQSPNRASRVTLGAERDALGLRRPVLDWRVNEIDRHTLATASRLYAQALTGAELARVQVMEWLLAEATEGFSRMTGDWHQLGTTRMADTPTRGVVDKDCRVFDVDNLYVAGASVFPTSGAMNPTLTVVALALRLADHLAS
jgi:choline dehydrogenase-like flavoprotein